jgi:hypothetical protein
MRHVVKELDSVHRWHLVVGADHVEGAPALDRRAGELDGAERRCAPHDVELGEDALDRLEGRLIVVDHEDPDARGLFAGLSVEHTNTILSRTNLCGHGRCAVAQSTASAHDRSVDPFARSPVKRFCSVPAATFSLRAPRYITSREFSSSCSDEDI